MTIPPSVATSTGLLDATMMWRGGVDFHDPKVTFRLSDRLGGLDRPMLVDEEGHIECWEGTVWRLPSTKSETRLSCPSHASTTEVAIPWPHQGDTRPTKKATPTGEMDEISRGTYQLNGERMKMKKKHQPAKRPSSVAKPWSSTHPLVGNEGPQKLSELALA